MKAKQISFNEFLKEFDPSIHNTLKNVRNKQGVEGIAGLKCQVMDSSRFGMLTALIYGPDCTFKTVEQMDIPQGVYVTGMPSSAAFVEFYTTDKPESENTNG